MNYLYNSLKNNEFTYLKTHPNNSKSLLYILINI